MTYNGKGLYAVWVFEKLLHSHIPEVSYVFLSLKQIQKPMLLEANVSSRSFGINKMYQTAFSAYAFYIGKSCGMYKEHPRAQFLYKC